MWCVVMASGIILYLTPLHEREPGSTTHPGIFSRAFLWLCAHLLMELNLMDTALSQTNRTPVAASLYLNRHNELKNTPTFSRQNRQTGIPCDLGTTTQDKTLSDKHVFIVLSFITDSSTTIKDTPPPLSQKSLKVTEWILIRSGVVNSSQHGIQWD